MRYSFALLLLAALPAGAQFLSFGITAGVPLTDALSARTGAHASATAYGRRFTIGPTMNLRLAPRFWFETGALYRRNGFQYNTPSRLGYAKVAVDDWQFPFLGKYELHGGPIRPFIDIGYTLRHISNAPNSNVGGGTFGGGVSIHVLSFRLAPQIRYTRWGSHAFNQGSGVLVSNLNQLDFLVELMF